MHDNKDQEWIIRFKNRLKETRKKRFPNQNEFAQALSKEKSLGGRTAITNWESPNQQTLPNLLSFFKICEALDVDANYLAGVTEYEKPELKDICERLNISQDTAIILKNNPNLGTFIDTFIKTETLTQIITRINMLAQESAINTAINSNFRTTFITKLERIYAGYYYTTTPSSVNEDTWYSYLLSDNGIPYGVYNSPDEFVRQTFLEEGKNNLRFSNENYDELNNLEKHLAILEMVADFSYDYLTRKMALDFSKKHIADKLNQVIDEYIKSESDKIIEIIKSNI